MLSSRAALTAFCTISFSSFLLRGLDQGVDGQLDHLSREGLQRLKTFQFREAARLFSEGAQLAEGNGSLYRSAKFWNAAAGADFNRYHYREALRSYEKTLSIARDSLSNRQGLSEEDRKGLLSVAAAATINLCSLYLELKELGSMRLQLREAHRYVDSVPRYLSQVLLLEARLAMLERRETDARRAYGQALELTDADCNWGLRSLILSDLGAALLRNRDWDQAESYLLEAFRVRIIHRTGNAERTLRLLAAIELGKGRLPEAEQYANLAVQYATSSPTPETRWMTHYQRAVILSRMARRDEALGAFRTANQEISVWRSYVLSSFRSMAQSDVVAAGLSSAYSDLAASWGLRSPDRAAEGLLAVESHRAASVLTLSARNADVSSLGPDYLDKVSRLQMLSIQGKPEDEVVRAKLRKELTDLEALSSPGLPLDAPPSEGARGLIRLQRALPPGTVAFSFSLGAERSWRWVVTPEALFLRQLPSQADIAREVSEVHRAIQGPAPGRALRQLGRLLFDVLPAPALQARHWVLSLDGVLLEIPLAALRIDEGPGEQDPLVMRRSLRTVPSLMALLDKPLAWRRGSLLAVADPIYNRADPRFPRSRVTSRRKAGGPWGLFAAPLQTGSAPDRARLAGSLEEGRRIAALWKSVPLPARFISGQEVSATVLNRELAADPSVIHMAGHVDGYNPDLPLASDPYIALSLKPDGTADAVGPEALIRLRLPYSVVVLNGCASGRGKIQPGLGLTGLVQAWLLGGASAVIGSLWPVQDDSGSLFEAFYKEILQGRHPSEALRQAQVSCIRAGGWQAEPSHWAAWTITARK